MVMNIFFLIVLFVVFYVWKSCGNGSVEYLLDMQGMFFFSVIYVI